MTNQEQTDYWHKWSRFQKRYEAIYTTRVYAALREQVNQYIQSGNINSIDAGPLYEVLRNLYKTVGVQWAAKSNYHTQMQLKQRLPMGFSERIVELMRQYYGIDLLNMSEGITKTTRDLIVKVLSDAAITGASFDDIVKELRNTELNRIRARLIARTEVNASANLAAVIQGRDSRLVLDKVWISVRDQRTRPDHVNVDGHKVGIDDDFKVGDDLMGQPGDKRGGADQCCNCRCVVALTARRDSRGRLVIV